VGTSTIYNQQEIVKMKITRKKLKKLIKETLEDMRELTGEEPLGPSPGSPSSPEDSSQPKQSDTPDVSKVKAGVAQRFLKKLQSNQALQKQLEKVIQSNDSVGKQQIVAWWAKTLGLDVQKDASKIRSQAKRLDAV